MTIGCYQQHHLFLRKLSSQFRVLRFYPVSISPQMLHSHTSVVYFRRHVIQGYRKRWTGFETAITEKVLDRFTRLAS